MVVKRKNGGEPPVTPAQLDLGYLGLFLGLRVNELVMDRLHRQGFADVKERHGYVIQHFIEKERSITELARRMQVTQQAASKTVAELLQFGLLELMPAQDRRSKLIRLSRRGWRSVQLGRRLRSHIEQQLTKAAGSARYNQAKKTLLICLDHLGGVHRIKSRRIRPPA